MKRLNVLLLVILGLYLSAASAAARQSDAERAAVAIDIDVEKLAGPAVMGLAQNMTGGPISADDLDVLRQTSRIRVFMSAPESVEVLSAMQGEGEPIPFEVYVRVDFKSADARQQLIDSMKPGIEEVEENGASVFKPTEIGPPNLRMRKSGEGSVEFGTVGFMESTDQNFLTANLEKAWGAAPPHAFRLAVDVGAAKSLVDGLLAQAGTDAPPPVRPFLELIPKISTLRLSFDGKDATMVSLAIEGVDEAAGQSLFEGLEGLLGMGKMSATQGLAQLNQTSPAMGKVGSDIVESLQSKRDGSSVRLEIPRPEGLDEAIKEMSGMGQSAEGGSDDGGQQ
jgi:hypothetical protein